MRRWVYGELKDGQLVLTSADGREERSGETPLDAVLLSRLDFTLSVFQIPRLRDDELRQVIRYRLRGVYPGNTEEMVFDHEVIERGARRTVVATVTRKDVFEAVRKAVPGRPLYLPWHIINSMVDLHGSGKRTVLFFHRSWIEVLRCEGAFPLDSTVFIRRSSISDAEQLGRITGGSHGPSPIICIAAEGELQAIREATVQVFGGEGVRYLGLETVLASIGNDRHAVFGTRRRMPLPSFAARCSVLLVLIGIATLRLFWAHVEGTETYLGLIEDRHVSLTREVGETEAVSREIERLEGRFVLYEREQQPDLYRMFSLLRDTLGDDVLLDTFRMRNRGFQCEGRGRNPFSFVERFAAMGDLFSEITVVRASTLLGSELEHFILTGIYHGD